MILLGTTHYAKVLPALNKVEINTLFARTVLEKHLPGKVYADEANSPSTFLIVHPYGMSLLFGDANNPEIAKWIKGYALNTPKVRSKHEWMQVFPSAWASTFEQVLGNHLVKGEEPSNSSEKRNVVLENTRVNFRFNRQKFLTFKQNNLHEKPEIVRVDEQLFNDFDGAVVPKYFWTDARHFMSQGVAYCTVSNGQPSSMAFAAYVHKKQLEMGIETAPEFRGKGLAMHACAALIDYCIENNFEPVWGCRMENTSSYNLAQKLGFEPTKYIPYYRLSNQ